MNIGKLLSAAVKAIKANPAVIVSAVTAIGPIFKAIKAETKKPSA